MSMTAVECRGATAAAGRDTVRYEIVDRLTAVPPDGARVLSLWHPFVSDSPYQRVLDAVVTSSDRWSLTREAAHGNVMLHANVAGGRDRAAQLEVRYLVERTPVAHALHPACARPLGDPALFARHLTSERFVDVNDVTRELARVVAGAETNPLLQARRFYDHVGETLTYDATNQSWKGSTEHALVCSAGNCNDIHALFISLCRSAGIPARLVMGQALEEPPPGEEACDRCGYHCWAEFFVAGLGWVPVDASCACKYGKHELFGDLETNHVAWSVGRDLSLAPVQNGPPLLFFAGPYAELDGAPWNGAERSIRFEQL